ncbi:methylenetetrahydrofolate reductase C-terminal domain-containing protein [Salinibacterium sp. G-O1]|uniref:methylenetetrahydrofolate reductase C-terminal domain-containing protein n=1 Tax=Salinibacterium sp. G-O1 TaxID=3046208 RepID=UPI0024BB7EEB|nr:methylenetetrahydrofolate reductase C-terminal domain-containing protein [Salinibacterium sp. G-O1]MDJ0335823.1 methylenetetrahydrofolate reductase C-terminal domain-containing protein [Salinibacterium sp. G-O1]
MPEPTIECPKHMQFGPCGGVEFDGSCEVSPHPCVFLDLPTVRWPGLAQQSSARPSAGAVVMRELMRSRPIVVADFPAQAIDAESIAECAGIMRDSVDVVLAGDAGNARVQFPPAYRAALVMAAGLQVWSGFNCRDRNRVAMEGELAALQHAGVAGVHCVTGDHTATGQRPDAAPVFDLDSTQAASLARSFGHLVSVAEAPATPPTERRPERLLEKTRAGAEVCFVNHSGGAAPVADFIARSTVMGVEMAYIPCVPLIVDRGSAELLKTFTTMVLPDGYLDRILGAPDPFSEGIAAAVELSRELLQIDGVAGINLSGGATPGRSAWFAEALARTSRELA